MKGRTPSSSAKKRLALQFRMYSEVEEEKPSMLGNWRASGTKRALFRSPDRNSGAGISIGLLIFLAVIFIVKIKA